MLLQFSSKHADVYWCSHHYDIQQDAWARNGFTVRVGRTVYDSQKGFRRLPFVKEAQILKA